MLFYTVLAVISRIMIQIDWKNAKLDTPNFKITQGKKYNTIEIVWCLVSDGNEVWECNYDPTEGWIDDSIIKFIEIKNIKP